MTAWVRVRSWHVEYPGNQTRTLCGLRVAAHPLPGQHQVMGWSDELPAGKSCENCLRILARQVPDERIGEGTLPDDVLGEGAPA